MNIPQIEYVEEPHALLIEKHMEIQVGITFCSDKSQLEIEVVSKNFKDTFFQQRLGKFWNLLNCKFK
jgi:hypothetical protein